MAIAKYSGLKLGPGQMNQRNFESEFFSETRAPNNGVPGTIDWVISNTYVIGNAVTYNGLSYNSLILGNIGNTPDVSPSSWSLVDGKDGDVWVQVPAAGFPVGGGDSEIWIKVNTIWRPLAWTNPTTVALTDGQLTSDIALEYPVSVFPYCVMEYTIKRTTGLSRKRTGKMVILNDGSVVRFSHEFQELGFDVNVPFDLDIFAGKVRILYTSAAEGLSITMRYVIRGWN
jgi:hypothetical protein